MKTTVNLSPSAIEAIHAIQSDGEMHDIINGVEDYLIEICDTDEKAAVIMGHIRSLRIIKYCLLQVIQSEEDDEQ